VAKPTYPANAVANNSTKQSLTAAHSIADHAEENENKNVNIITILRKKS
jgi:hypothetical protein